MNFWDVHGIGFIICLCFFPRLTILFAVITTGGIFWWLGFILTPRLLVAILATTTYWDTNTFLVILTWIWAIGGESTEKKTGAKAVKHTTTRATEAEWKEVS